MSTKEELLLRALDTTNFANFVHEDLSDLMSMVTPTDVPLLARLRRTTASNLLHEWTEGALTGTLSNAAYGDGLVPTEHTNTHVRKDNKVMSIGRIAKATNLLNATNTIGKSSQGLDAFARELEEKMQDTMRAIEYFVWNGNRGNTSPQEMDGILNVITGANGANVVANGNAKLVEDKLKEAITKCYNTGGSPNWILARPEVAYQIANFTDDKIRYAGPGAAAGGVGAETLRYLSPFGQSLEVIPVRADFLPSGNVFVVDSSKLTLPFLSNGIEMMDLAIDADLAGKKLIKAYLTLEVRAVSHHARITGVLD